MSGAGRGDTITTIRQTCKCGHDLASHFDKGAGNCLCNGCNCRGYVNEDEQDPTPTERSISTDDGWRYPQRRSKPHASYDCNCAACRRWKYGY